MKHDTGMLKGYSDDIDALLVFVSLSTLTVRIRADGMHQAGLFSAILTAFVVQTYPLLQADNTDTTNQILALGVATELREKGITTSGSLNQTLTSLLDSPEFSAPNSVRWINIFFFLSLVFSLAAALFGIRAKQWIREYMNWNAPLATPRENVLVRQIRIEGWEAWNVSATISSIPALLELAMILFLIGVTQLLWTLDDIVAVVITLAVGIFLCAVASFTIFPILFTRCPYKSPTAWAFLRLLNLARYTIPLYAARAVKLFKNINIDERLFGTPFSWRQRDLDAHTTTVRWWRPSKFKELRMAAWCELAKERTPLREDGSFEEDPENAIRFIAYRDGDDLLEDVMKTALLVRALSWVRVASQDSNAKRYMEECLDDFRDNDSEAISPVADWCLLLAVQQNVLDKPLSVLSADTEYYSSRSSSLTITALRAYPNLTSYFDEYGHIGR